jgi:hypothetical protein
VVLFQDGPELNRGEGSSHYQLGQVANRLPKDAGVASAYVEKIGVPKFYELRF